MDSENRRGSERKEGIAIPPAPTPFPDAPTPISPQASQKQTRPAEKREINVIDEIKRSEHSLPPAPGHEEIKSLILGDKENKKEAVAQKETPERESKAKQPDAEKPHHGVMSKISSDAQDISVSPPLFIKIDKYSELVKDIQKLKGNMLALRDALDAISDIEKELISGISLAHKALDDFSMVISSMDSKLLRAHSIDNVPINTKEMDSYIKGVYEKMERIKKELESVGMQ